MHVATIVKVNNPGNANSGNSSNGVGMIVGLIVTLAIILIFFVYVFPMLRQISAPQITIPNKVDINVHSAK